MLTAIRSCVVSALCLFGASAAQSQTLQRLDVDVFNSGTVWPVWVAQDKGFFAANGLDIHLIPTPGSLAQMEGLIDGKFDIAMTAIDNLIAYMEGEGEAKTDAIPNIVAVMGSDNGFLSLVTSPTIKSFDALRGATLSVDALTTGYAFVLEEMLKQRGLTSSDYTLVKAGGFQQRFDGLIAGAQAGTLSVPPFTFVAAAKGFNDLGTAISVLGHYQGVVAAVRKDWAPGHRDALIGYIRAYIAAVTWLYDPANKADVGLGAMQMADRGFAAGWGMGRHVLGSNYFHYVRDPWGSYSEYSSDIDYIPVDVDWPATDHPDRDAFYVWGPVPPGDFVHNYEIGG